MLPVVYAFVAGFVFTLLVSSETGRDLLKLVAVLAVVALAALGALTVALMVRS